MSAFSSVRNSLAFRLFVTSTVIALAAAILVTFILTQAFRTSEKQAFRDLMHAHLLALVAQVEFGSDGTLSRVQDSGFAEFSREGAPWFWQVGKQNRSGTHEWTFTSPSLKGAAVHLPSEPAFDDNFERYFRGDFQGNEIGSFFLETKIFLDRDDVATSFVVAAPATIVDDRVARFRLWLLLWMAAFAALLVVSNLIAVKLGLRPLAKITSELDEVRRNERSHLSETVPSEVLPLVRANVKLIENNHLVLERAKAQVGNLAHALKTPLAVMLNEGSAKEKLDSNLVHEQAQNMQNSVQKYLERAHLNANRASFNSFIEPQPVIERMLRVMKKLQPECTFEFEGTSNALSLAVEQEDFEEALGNIIENAARHAKSLVKIELEPAPLHLHILIHDDGDGLDDTQKHQALLRGRRLDETTSGSGLGLSIVKEIVEAYSGNVVLDRSPLGGLMVTMKLPLWQ